MAFSKKQHHPDGHRIIQTLVLCLFGLCVTAAAATRKARKPDSRVHLIHADELRYDMYGPAPDAQIVKGKVHFEHDGAQLWCDSAYFYQQSNSVKAFGNVRFRQGDTLSLDCDRAAYDGLEQLMMARSRVIMHHRRQTLHCDSLNFNRLEQYAYFFEGGELIDGRDHLVADWGGYHTDTRIAEFYYKVHMYNGERDIRTDTLHYDVRQSKAHVTGPSTITTKTSTVKTKDAWFNSSNRSSEMFGRSTIIDGAREITGDTLTHNDDSGISQGFGNVIYVDKENRNELHGGYVYYNDKTGFGFATQRPVAVDYSQQDTLWMHSDTMKVYTYNINTDSAYRTIHCYPRVRAFRTDLQAVCDSLVGNSLDSSMTMYKDPVVWNNNRQLLGEVIKVYMNDSTIRQANVIGQTLSIEKIDDKDHYNQVSSKEMQADFVDGAIRRITNSGNVRAIYFPVDDKDTTLIGLNYTETDTMRMSLSPERQLQKIWMPKATGTLYPMTQIPPDKMRLRDFVWLDDIRPTDKHDIFRIVGKSDDQKLRVIERHSVPLQSF